MVALHHYHKRIGKNVAEPAPWVLTDMLKAYHWPANLAGGGRIAIVELGGGYYPEDTEEFCKKLGLPVPNVSHQYLGGTEQQPGTDADGEVALDVQVAAGAYSFATKDKSDAMKPADITIFWADTIDNALSAATLQLMDVFSCSWGNDEAQWGETALRKTEALAESALNAGMVSLAASGDNDSGDGGTTPANVDGPASCPSFLACGGTRLLHDGTETVWNNEPGQTNGSGTGGGYSTVFPWSKWQAGAAMGPGRMVPDIAANADPETGIEIVINGQWEVIGGTSGVAPLYAGLLAACGRDLRWIAPALWKNHMCFKLITQGDNGAFRAGPMPSPTCGLGSPIADKIAALMGAMHNP